MRACKTQEDVHTDPSTVLIAGQGQGWAISFYSVVVPCRFVRLDLVEARIMAQAQEN
jgi:hypothetical protein